MFRANLIIDGLYMTAALTQKLRMDYGTFSFQPARVENCSYGVSDVVFCSFPAADYQRFFPKVFGPKTEQTQYSRTYSRRWGTLFHPTSLF